MRAILASLLIACGMVPALSAAQSGLELGVALVYGPDYSGAKKSSAMLVPLIGYEDERLSIRPGAGGIKYNLVATRALQFGPQLSFRSGRDADDSSAVERLPDIDRTTEVGVFLNGYLPLFLLFGEDASGIAGASLSYLRDTGEVHESSTTDLSFSYVVPDLGGLTLITDASLSYGAEGFMETYYGVTASGAAASGLRAYTPKAGLFETGLSLTGVFALSERQSLIGVLSLSELQGEAAKSPIVRSGSKSATSLVFGYAWSF